MHFHEWQRNELLYTVAKVLYKEEPFLWIFRSEGQAIGGGGHPKYK